MTPAETIQEYRRLYGKPPSSDELRRRYRSRPVSEWTDDEWREYVRRARAGHKEEA